MSVVEAEGNVLTGAGRKRYFCTLNGKHCGIGDQSRAERAERVHRFEPVCQKVSIVMAAIKFFSNGSDCRSSAQTSVGVQTPYGTLGD